MISPTARPLRAAAPARVLALALLLLVGAAAGCGKKGPPLAPLLKVPAVPPETAARREGAVANLQFRVPAANTDNTHPADIVRVEVYGFTGSTPAAADVVKYGTLVASIPVRKPPEEEEEEEPEKPREERGAKAPGAGQPASTRAAAPSRPPSSLKNGFDQGDLVVVTEALGPAQMKVVEPKPPKGRRPPVAAEGHAWQPRLQPEAGKGEARLYFVVGVNHKGQRGPFSPPQPVALTDPPSPPPSTPEIDYTEKAITLSWQAPADLPRPIQAPPEEGMLESTSRSYHGATGGYNVYETGGPDPAAPAQQALAGSLAKPLNEKPLDEPAFTVPDPEFGKERCFAVRAVVQLAGQVGESEPTPASCVTPKDTFPPAPPQGLSAVGSEGAISLIWEAATAADLAGYVVLRAEGKGQPQALTPAPIKETTFRDATTARGVRYVYTVVAVDAAGNRSAPSNAVDETAR